MKHSILSNSQKNFAKSEYSQVNNYLKPES